MARALELAARGLYTTTPNPRVGCVIARGDVVIGEGFHARAGEAHAEVAALADAARRGDDVRGATLYVTLEPCNAQGRGPPCVDAVLAAGIARVVAAMQRSQSAQGGRRGDACARRASPSTSACSRTRRASSIPAFCRCIDARPALGAREGRREPRRPHGARQRRRASGSRARPRARTATPGARVPARSSPASAPCCRTTPRSPCARSRRRGSRGASSSIGTRETPANARVLAGDGALVVTAGERNPAVACGRRGLAAARRQGPRRSSRRMMRVLAARDINELHVEAGAKLNGALLDAGLVDEILLYVAPSVLGDPARGLFERSAPLAALAYARRDFALHDVRSHRRRPAHRRATWPRRTTDVHRHRADGRAHRGGYAARRRRAHRRRHRRPGTAATSRSATASRCGGCCLTVVAIEGATLERSTCRRRRCAARRASTARATSTSSSRCAVRPPGRPPDDGTRRRRGHRDAPSRRCPRTRTAAGGSTCEAPRELARFIAPKGSIAVDGVSLTVNEVAGARFRGQPHPAHARGDDASSAGRRRARQPRDRSHRALRGAHGGGSTTSLDEPRAR